MNDGRGYVVFFFPQALEALGEPFKPYLQGVAGNQYVLCREIDTAGAFITLRLSGQTHDGKTIQIELMVPSSMVRMVMSAQGDEQFGFRPRVFEAPMPSLPPVGPTAAPVQAPPQAVPPSTDAPTQTPPKP